MNEFDQFIKSVLRIKFYARYTDDFVMLGNDQKYLKDLIVPIQNFLKTELALGLHPSKVSIHKLESGIDFLGYVILPHYKALRTKTKKRMLRKLKEKLGQYKQGIIDSSSLNQSLQSYLGIIFHANAHKLSQELKNVMGFYIVGVDKI